MPVPIVYQNFIPPAIDAGNLNTVNNVVYTVIGDGTNAPLNAANVRANIGLGTMAVQNAGAVAITGGTMTGVSTGGLLNVQRFTSSGTYTPTAGTTSIVVEAIGGGGAGGGCPATSAGQVGAGAGGGGGGYTVGRFTSGFAGLAVTIGAGGVPVVGVAGGAGGVTSLGSLITANGGAGGNANGGSAGPFLVVAGAGAAASSTGGNILANAGNTGVYAEPRFANTYSVGSSGGPGPFGGFGAFSVGAPATNGTAAPAGAFGGGGGGGSNIASVVTAGGAGGIGTLIIYEYS